MDQAPRTPPEAPTHLRKLRLKPSQALGMSLIIAIPALAALRLVGEHRVTRSVGNAELEVTLEYPDRALYREDTRLLLQATNRGSRRLDALTVALARGYLERFSAEAPNMLGRVEDSALVFDLPALPPGAMSELELKLRPEEYFGARGAVKLAGPGLSPVVAELTTFVFP